MLTSLRPMKRGGIVLCGWLAACVETAGVGGEAFGDDSTFTGTDTGGVTVTVTGAETTSSTSSTSGATDASTTDVSTSGGESSSGVASSGEESSSAGGSSSGESSSSGAAPVCGNGVVDVGEMCDGNDLDGQTCAQMGLPAGTLTCSASCQSFDTSGCCLALGVVCAADADCCSGNCNNGQSICV